MHDDILHQKTLQRNEPSKEIFFLESETEPPRKEPPEVVVELHRPRTIRLRLNCIHGRSDVSPLQSVSAVLHSSEDAVGVVVTTRHSLVHLCEGAAAAISIAGV